MRVRDTSKYLKFDLGKLTMGKSVEVALSGSVANVKLINNSNMYNYERSREYKYSGGLVTESPVVVHIPSNDRWFIVVDTKELDGLEGEVTASVRVL